MAGEISSLSPLTSWATGDLFEVVDVSDVSMAAAGTNKRITGGNLFGATTAVPVDLKFASGQGVVFGGNETLKNYDETAFTPTVIDDSSPVGAGSYNQQVGIATRIGRIVFYQLRIRFTKGTLSGNIFIGGLPVNADASLARSAFIAGVVDEITFNSVLGGHNVTSSATIQLREFSSAGVVSNITDADLHATNEMVIEGSGFYHV